VCKEIPEGAGAASTDSFFFRLGGKCQSQLSQITSKTWSVEAEELLTKN